MKSKPGLEKDNFVRYYMKTYKKYNFWSSEPRVARRNPKPFCKPSDFLRNQFNFINTRESAPIAKSDFARIDVDFI